jgi:hypothetical protein
LETSSFKPGNRLLILRQDANIYVVNAEDEINQCSETKLDIALGAFHNCIKGNTKHSQGKIFPLMSIVWLDGNSHQSESYHVSNIFTKLRRKTLANRKGKAGFLYIC